MPASHPPATCPTRGALVELIARAHVGFLHHLFQLDVLELFDQLRLDVRPGLGGNRAFGVLEDQLGFDKALEQFLHEHLALGVQLVGRNAVLVVFNDLIDGAGHLVLKDSFRAHLSKFTHPGAWHHLVGGHRDARRPGAAGRAEPKARRRAGVPGQLAGHDAVVGCIGGPGPPTG